ncbi:MAG: hypothetical protein LRY43_02130 [Gammaproteobacteria bacterium]|nr:hypothetical protein [Gammaproteobacteria bacterium]
MIIKRYGKTDDIFNHDTDVMESIINKISPEKENQTSNTHQLRKRLFVTEHTRSNRYQNTVEYNRPV